MTRDRLTELFGGVGGASCFSETQEVPSEQVFFCCSVRQKKILTEKSCGYIWDVLGEQKGISAPCQQDSARSDPVLAQSQRVLGPHPKTPRDSETLLVLSSGQTLARAEVCSPPAHYFHQSAEIMDQRKKANSLFTLFSLAFFRFSEIVTFYAFFSAPFSAFARFHSLNVAFGSLPVD